ncbi:putative copine [Helianthus annuus]|nr:putative copine [Helianthus annuus]
MFSLQIVAKFFIVAFIVTIWERSFNRRSLHSIGDVQNPYEQAISIIGKTLPNFDEDNLIPCFGFGDGIQLYYNSSFSTHDQQVFSFYPDSRYCQGFEDVLRRYREIVPHIRLAGLFATPKLFNNHIISVIF